MLLWFGAVPPASALVAHDIVNETIFDWLTAWVDRHFRGEFIGRLFRCQRCMVHWVVLGFALLFLPCWLILPLPGIEIIPTVLIGWLATVRLSFLWFPDDNSHL